MCSASAVFERIFVMAGAAKQKLGRSGMLMLLAMAMFALFVAFVVGPAVSRATGIADIYISLALGVGFFVIAVAATLLARSMQNKNPSGGK
jgi:predicted histidine transporter YuiF (NhaC family)